MRIAIHDIKTGKIEVREATPEEAVEIEAGYDKKTDAQRKIEEKQREENAKRFRESLKYEYRIVAFLDILGWSGAIERSIDDEKLAQQLGIALGLVRGQVKLHEEANKRFKQIIESIPNSPYPDIQMTHFSDSLLLSTTPESNLSLIMFLQYIVSSLLELGFFVRGGITSGLLIHRSSIAYGPALIRAYHLEKKVARDPRIILDTPLAEAWGQGLPICDKHGAITGQQTIWRLDKDGWRFFDFLQPFPFMGFPASTNSIKATLEPARQLIIKRLSEHKGNDRIYPKYQWASHYFNEMLKENPGTDIEEIPLH